MTTDSSAGRRVALCSLTLTLVVAFVPPSWTQETPTSSTNEPRIEKDLLGEKEIPAVFSEPHSVTALTINLELRELSSCI